MKNKLIKLISAVCVFILIFSSVSMISGAVSGNISRDIIEKTSKVAVKIEEEGIVLLKNEDDLLPLNGRKLNIFGVGSAFPFIGGTGSGCTTSDDPVYLYDALDKAGVQYNKDLRKLYESNGGKSDLPYVDHTIINNLINLVLLKNTVDEMDPRKLTDKVISDAVSFSDTAMIVIGRTGTEGGDISESTLRLNDKETAMVKKVCGAFENVIVLFNTGNIIEMGFLDEYESIKAALEVWIPGEFGFESVADVLTGKVNPSGRLNDTVAYKISDHPSNENFGDYTFKGSNDHYVEYQEGIYVGYRYFETLAQDKVQFPFGFGLSYTDFSQEILSHSVENDEVKVEVKVTNIGNTPGKEVVQIYYSAPYNPGGIEKSSVVLAAFDKTELLQSGESENLTLTYPVRDMASYDYKVNKAYTLEKGDYEIILGKNAREAFDSFTYSVRDDIIYDVDPVTGTKVTNVFDFAYNGFTELSRSDSAGTYPASRTLKADDSIKKADSLPEPIEGTPPVTGAVYDKTITLKDVSEDDSLWDIFLDQFTLEEQFMMVAFGGYQTYGIERLGIPHTMDDDGPLSVKGRNGTVFSDSGTAYPCETCIACTWNTDLAELMGESAAIEAADMGVDVWYAPAVNIHRSPRGGRNYEYFSEDPLVSGKMAAAIINGCNKIGLVTTVKHFAMNDQETHRQGIATYANEQAIREIYLRPFEIAVKEGHTYGVMAAHNRIGAYWCGACSPLCKQVLRNEWGFEGFVVSDYVVNLFMSGYESPAMGAYNGNDVMLNGIWELEKFSNLTMLRTAYAKDPVGFGYALRESCKNVCTMVMHTKAFNDPGEYPEAGKISNWLISPLKWNFEFPFVKSTVKYILHNMVNTVCWLLYLILM